MLEFVRFSVSGDKTGLRISHGVAPLSGVSLQLREIQRARTTASYSCHEKNKAQERRHPTVCLFALLGGS